jgi:hypothetical protein
VNSFYPTIKSLKLTPHNFISLLNYKLKLNLKLKKMSKPEQKFKILIDQKPFEVENQFITGTQIKALVSAPANYGVWLKGNGPTPDKQITDNEQVDLAQPGREHFFTGSVTTTEG